MTGADSTPLALGLDPGARGAVAALLPDGRIARVWRVDEHTLAELADGLRAVAPRVRLAVLERVTAMPGRVKDGEDKKGKGKGGKKKDEPRRRMGAASMFQFGQRVGELRALLAALRLPWREVTPGSWQRALGCLSRGRKAVTRAAAQQRWPDGYVDHRTQRRRRITDATADALLIAEHARQLALREHLF